MLTRARSEAGVTLIELLVAMVLMVVVTGATLTAFDALSNDHQTTERHVEAQAKARQAMGRLSRELRNLASPTVLTAATAAQPQAIDRAEPFDLVFRTVDQAFPTGSTANAANVMRVRYCLSENPANKRRWRLWVQTQRWKTATPPAVPGGTACPTNGWDTETIHTTEIVNTTQTTTAPVPAFTFGPPCAAMPCTAADLQRITKVRTQLVVDNDPDRRPLAARLTSSVILRNQNQFPRAAFNVSVLDNVRNLRLDGSPSSDPEGQALRYCWFRNPTLPLPSCTAPSKPASYIGEGVVLSYTAPAGTSTFYLRVEDPAGLSAESTQTGTY